MKARNIAFAAALLSAACITSCSSDESVSDQKVSGTYPKIIKVNVDKPETSSTRVILDNGNKPVFEEYGYDFETFDETGDYIIVYSQNEDGDEIMAYYNCIDAKNGLFTIDEDFGGWVYNDGEQDPCDSEPVGPYIVAYPGNTDPDGNVGDQMMVLSTYGFTDGKAGKVNSAVMSCMTDDLTDVTLKNNMALLKVTVPAGTHYTSVGIKAYMCMNVLYDFSTGEMTPIEDIDYTTPVIDAAGRIFYIPDFDETEDDVETLEPGVYYIPVIPQTLTAPAGQPTMSLVTSSAVIEFDEEAHPEKYTTLKSKTGSITFEAGKIYDLGSVE